GHFAHRLELLPHHEIHSGENALHARLDEILDLAPGTIGHDGSILEKPREIVEEAALGVRHRDILPSQTPITTRLRPACGISRASWLDARRREGASAPPKGQRCRS